MIKSKVESYIGFCIKSRKISLGTGSVDVLKSGVYLLVLSADASENTKKLAVKYMNRFSCPLIICKNDFERIVNKPGCKIAAIRDSGLARAITDSIDENYEFYAGGNGKYGKKV